jgi:hypothetical protein
VNRTRRSQVLPDGVFYSFDVFFDSFVPAAGSHHGSVAAVTHDHAALVGSATGTWFTAAALLAVLVVAALATRRVVTPGVAESRVESRADACCEAVMALVAAGMLAAPLLAAAA